MANRPGSRKAWFTVPPRVVHLRITPQVKTNAGPPPNVTRVVKLSVIVPFYNVQHIRPDTLRSLRANAREDFEFILVDDCSTDGTPDILERAERELPGAVLIRHEQNGGLATARNTGLDAARGEYLTFLDGDDWLAPGYYAQLLAAIEELGCDFVRTDHVQCTARARTVHRVPHGRRGVVLNPREAILPADRSTSVDYAYAWAGHLPPPARSTAGCCTSPTGCAPPRTGRGSGGCTARRSPSPWSACSGVFYRRGVASSLTQIGDVRQLDFIRAFDQVIEETAQDPDADKLLPKAVRTYCAIISHHLGPVERFEPQVARKLRSMSAAALKRMPQDVLDGRARLDGRRARLPAAPAAPPPASPPRRSAA